MKVPDHIPSIPFKQWVWKNQENRCLLALSGTAVLIQFIWFKRLYPYPNFLPDSYSYLDAAFNNYAINMWPIGYSKFLRLFSCFTHWDTALVFFQYAFLQAAILYLLFTIRYLLSPVKWVMYVLFAGNILNPLLLHVSNFISSDALFAALSMIWFTQLLWILYVPASRLLMMHALVLLLVFIVRYNALYYPVVSITLIAFASLRIWHKIAALAMIVITISLFVGYTMYTYRKKTDTTQFSAFGGWQLASNALFAYAHVKHLQAQVPIDFRQLHAITNKHMDSLTRVQQRPDSALGIYYLWNNQAPLKQYMAIKYKNDSITDGFKQWASMAPLYAKYGAYLVRTYPFTFLRYYIWPNMEEYYSPTPEFLAIYNMGSDKVENIAKTWFHYKTNKVHATTKDKDITIAAYFPVVLAITNVAFILGFVGFVFLEGFKKNSHYFNSALCWMLLIWVCNVGFSVLASPVVLRYQVFPMVTTFSFMTQLIAFIIQESRATGTKETRYESEAMELPVSHSIMIN